MHYIRFLKPPVATPAGRPNSKAVVVRAVLTVTTDLGEDFYPEDLELKLTFEALGKVILQDAIAWRGSSRTVSFESRFDAAPKSSVKLMVRPSRAEAVRFGTSEDGALLTPAILSACSQVVFDVHKSHEAPQHVQRQLALPDGRNLTVCEELGESIARHAWDAGVALVGLIGSSHLESLPELNGMLSGGGTRRIDAIELGSGCGLVAAGLANGLRNLHIVATDLVEAIDTMRQTFASNRLAKNSEIEVQVLDWNEQVGPSKGYDLIIAADCTYNPDSSLALVKTIHRLASRSAARTLVAVATKVRHPSEAVFFEHMAAAGFEVKEQICVWCPHKVNGGEGDAVERVDAFVFALRN